MIRFGLDPMNLGTGRQSGKLFLEADEADCRAVSLEPCGRAGASMVPKMGGTMTGRENLSDTLNYTRQR